MPMPHEVTHNQVWCSSVVDSPPTSFSRPSGLVDALPLWTDIATDRVADRILCDIEDIARSVRERFKAEMLLLMQHSLSTMFPQALSDTARALHERALLKRALNEMGDNMTRSIDDVLKPSDLATQCVHLCKKHLGVRRLDECSMAQEGSPFLDSTKRRSRSESCKRRPWRSLSPLVSPRSEAQAVEGTPEPLVPDVQPTIDMSPFLRVHGLADLNSTCAGLGDFVNDDVWNVLHCAAFHGRADIVKALLIDDDFPVNAVTGRYHGNALGISSYAGHEEVVELLLGSTRYRHINSYDEFGLRPLHAAVQGGHLTCIRMLFADERISTNTSTRSGSSPFAIAAAAGHCAVIGFMMANDAVDVNECSQDGSALHIAPTKEIAQMLLMAPRFDSVNVRDCRGGTALHRAVVRDQPEIVRAILKSPRFHSIDAVDNKGRSAAHLAVLRKRSDCAAIILTSKYPIQDRAQDVAAPVQKKAKHFAAKARYAAAASATALEPAANKAKQAVTIRGSSVVPMAGDGGPGRAIEGAHSS